MSDAEKSHELKMAAIICMTIVFVILIIFGGLFWYQDRKNLHRSHRPYYSVTYDCGEPTIVPTGAPTEAPSE